MPFTEVRPNKPALYSMYIQATRLNSSSGKIMRRQWIVLPPLTSQVAASFEMEPKDEFLMFHREQTNPENRVKWRAFFKDHTQLEMALPNTIRRMQIDNGQIPELNRWTISPIITAQVAPRELAEQHRSPETPYPLLRRFTKVAAKRYGLSI